MTRFRLAAGDTFRSLRVRNYRLFFVGQIISQAGTWMYMVAIIWVVLRLTDDGFTLGLAAAAQFVPVMLFGAWGGVIADRVDRHRFMISTQVAFTVISAVVAVLYLADLLTLGPIYLLSLAFGFATAMDNPVRRTLVVDLVDTADVPNAVALNSTLMTGSRVIGPAVAGLLITNFGVEWCFIVNTVSYFAVLFALARMDRSQIASSPKVARRAGQLREGLRYVWSHPDLRRPMLLMTVIGTLAFEFQVTLPLLAERDLGGDAGTFTLLYSTMSIGAVIGALAMARLRDVSTRLLALGSVGIGVSMLVLAASPNVPFALIALVPVGAGTIVLISGCNSVIQLRADTAMRGRALALTAVVFIGSTPIGGPIAGWVSEQFGARAGIVMGAVASLLVGGWALWALGRDRDPLAKVSGADDAPSQAPAVART